MSTVLTSSTTYLQFLSSALGFACGPMSQCIVCADAETGHPIAGVIYDNFNGFTIHAHIWVDAERRPSREWYAAIFDYPFNVCGVHKIIGQVNSTNEQARKLDEHFGFVLEAEVSDYYDHGQSLLVYTMTREQCRVLNSARWGRVSDKMKGIA